MRRKSFVAVIGLGSIAARHRKNIRLLFPDVQIIAISARELPIREMPENCDIVLDNIKQLVEFELEYVIIASPASMHVKQTIACIELNLPVLVEKPVGLTHSESELLNQIVTSRQSLVAVGYCLRYLSSATYVKNLVASGELGRIYNVQVNVGQYLPSWRKCADYQNSVSAKEHLGGGVLLELSHEFDYLNWIFGELSLTHAILRQSGALDTDVEEIADICLQTQNGAIVYLHMDFIQKTPQRKVTIIGEFSTVEWDVRNNQTTVYSSDKTLKSVASEQSQYDMYQTMLLDFHQALSGYDNRVVKVSDTLSTMRLISQIKQGFPLHGIIQ